MTRLDGPTLWQIPRVGSPVASRDGSVVVVPVATVRSGDNSLTTRVWRVDGDEPVPLTAADQTAGAPALSDDGTKLAFVRPVDGRPQVYVLRLDGGEAEVVTDLPLGATGPSWLPDGTGLIVFGEVFRHALDVEAAVEERDRLAEEATTARASEARLVRFWDRWLDDGKVPHLFHVDLDSGAATDLTPTWTRYFRFDNIGDPRSDVAIAPDGSEIVFAAARTDDPLERLNYDLYRLPISGGDPRRVTPETPGNVLRPRFTPDGTGVLFGRSDDDSFYAAPHWLHRLDLATDAIEPVLTEWSRAPEEWEFGPDGEVLVVAEDDARRRLFSLTDDGPVALTHDGWVSGLSVAGGVIRFNHSSLSAPGEAAVLDGDAVTLTTSFTAPALADIEMGPVEDVRYEGAEGAEIQMWVVHPPGFDPAGTYPLLHMIHGGPHNVFGDTWFWRWNAQVLAHAGYVVAHVNFHGSTSWGDEFARSIQGEWGDRPLRDVEAGTDALLARGYIDAERMAVTGGSYGGYLTAWITTQTDRYRCAIAHAAVTNLGGMAASDITFNRAASFGAEYFEDRERVERWSPSAHAGGHSTPTLVVHGERDYRVPVGQGLELYGVLKAKGIDARLLYFPDENHWVLKPANSIRWYAEFEGWLDRYLK